MSTVALELTQEQLRVVAKAAFVKYRDACLEVARFSDPRSGI